MFFNKTKHITFNNYKGFTLAETLITLVVIGVVAALTVPTLIVKHQKEETITRLKKVYSEMSQITNKAIADYGPIETWEVEDGKTKEFAEKYMIPYLRVAKICDYNDTGDCAFETSLLKTPNDKFTISTHYRFILDDGTKIAMKVQNTTVPDGEGSRPRIGASVLIDINGAKGPNTYGKDVFYFMYWIKENYRGINYSGKFVPNGGTIAMGNTRTTFKNDCKKTGNGIKCAALIMADGWTIADDYPW